MKKVVFRLLFSNNGLLFSNNRILKNALNSLKISQFLKIGTGTNFGAGNSKMNVSNFFEKGVGHFWEGDGYQKMLTSAKFQNGWIVMKIGTGTNFGVGNSKMEVSKSFEGMGHYWKGGGVLLL